MHTFKASEGKTVPKRPLSGRGEGSRKKALDNLFYIAFLAKGVWSAP